MKTSNVYTRMNNPVQGIDMHSAGSFMPNKQIMFMENLYKKIKWICLFILIVINMSSYAQRNGASEIIYNGLVKDANNTGIEGVTVTIQEINTKTVTDASGKFSITTASNNVLVFKKTGFLTKTFDLNFNESIELILEKAKILAGDDDYVEIPFAIRQKRYLTGAVSSIKTFDLPQPSTSSLANVLSGRLPGLNVLQAGTQPGSDFSDYRLRGRNSFNFVNTRVLVDGIERELSDLDFEEVESFSVLKDPATLSWYGLRGSQGIILVTTKKGNATQSSINFNAQYGLQNPDHMLHPLNSFEYATLYNEALLNDNPTAVPRYTQTALNAYKDGSNPLQYPDNNYQNEFIKSTAPFQRYVASAQGGDNNVRYFALLGYLEQEGLFNKAEGPDYNSNNAYKRFNFRGNIDFNVNAKFAVSVNLAGRVENRINPAFGTPALMGLINNTRPNAYPILNANGSFGGTTEDQNNILGAITSNGVIRAKQRVGFANVNATHKLDMLAKGLSANVLFSYDTRGDYSSGFSQNYRVFDASGSGNPIPYRTEARIDYRNAAYSNAFRSSEIWAGFDYDRSINDHKVNASVRGMRSEVIDFSSFSDFSQRLQGISSRIEYSFKQKYLLSLVGGYSGDDDLPKGKRYGFFPAISAGWIVSDENLLINSKLVSFLKIRGSYGQTGNTEIGFGDGLRRFPYESRYTRNLGSNASGYQLGTGFSLTGSANELNIGNPFITWETLTTTNLGLDFSLFGNTISATVDVFRNRREGILTSSSIPDIIGQTSGDLNEGIVNSKGIEGSLFYNRDFRNLKFSLNANFLLTDDEVINQGGQLGVPNYQRTIGFAAGTGLYYLSDGLYQNAAEISAGPKSTLSNQILPGDIRYKDMNNDNIINANDRVRYPFGSPAYLGFGTIVKYKIFDLNAQFQGSMGQKTDISNIVYAGPSSFNRESLNRWTPATAATAIYPRVGIANLGNNRANSDFWIRNSDYLKLKTIELGVTLPQSLAAKVKMQNLRFYFNGFNLITFSKLDLDVDPELPFLGRGSTYPYMQTYSLGINAKF
ncbi:SusC/RagA family TonB-linked outer membrane protein [Daejeonella sp.]|uniref:SusC/RagA family TonB-linked outer membrane protein n=1 Tax=Daejeonella sp. TaxID=2805397 RepID=UPI0030C0C3E7